MLIQSQYPFAKSSAPNTTEGSNTIIGLLLLLVIIASIMVFLYVKTKSEE